MTFIPVCLASEISTQKPKMFVIDGVKILLAKSNNNKIWAFDSTCTHADKSLENGLWDPENIRITCPFHRAVFDISQQGLAIKLPAVVPLKTYSVKIETINSELVILVDLDS